MRAQRGRRGISALFSLTSTLDRGGCQLHASAALPHPHPPPRERPGSHCKGACVGPTKYCWDEQIKEVKITRFEVLRALLLKIQAWGVNAAPLGA